MRAQHTKSNASAPPLKLDISLSRAEACVCFLHIVFLAKTRAERSAHLVGIAGKLRELCAENRQEVLHLCVSLINTDQLLYKLHSLLIVFFGEDLSELSSLA